MKLSERNTNESLGQVLALLGQRVRNGRTSKGLSRRALSELSGVSPRYLAQLESGVGNISIGVLLKIATVLEMTLAALLATALPLDNLRARRIALIGLRGAGKSTLGRLAAAELNTSFVELNTEIEAASGMPVGEVFALYGEAGYRRLECEALEKIVAEHDNLILAVAGGIVAAPRSYAYLETHFARIWLKARAEEHLKRVQMQGDERPMIGHQDALSDLKAILINRQGLYSRATAQVDTAGQAETESLAALLGAIERL